MNLSAQLFIIYYDPKRMFFNSRFVISVQQPHKRSSHELYSVKRSPYIHRPLFLKQSHGIERHWLSREENVFDCGQWKLPLNRRKHVFPQSATVTWAVSQEVMSFWASDDGGDRGWPCVPLRRSRPWRRVCRFHGGT